MENDRKKYVNRQTMRVSKYRYTTYIQGNVLLAVYKCAEIKQDKEHKHGSSAAQVPYNESSDREGYDFIP